MTDAEIIKALECPTGEPKLCKDCPYNNTERYPFCRESCAKDALDLIHRKNAEIERLRIVHKCIDEAILGNKEFAIADEYLIAYRGALKQLYDNTKIRAEAIKEFAERLKERSFSISIFLFDSINKPCIEAVKVNDIDNLVKEMAGEK